MQTIIINVVSVNQAIDAIIEATHDFGGWDKVNILLVGDVDAKAEIFDGIRHLTSVESLIIQKGSYYIVD